MTFMELAAARYSVRKFKPDPVAPELITKILEAGRLSPTAHNGQPQRIKVISDEEGLKKLDDCSPCRYGAPAVMIVCADTSGSFKRPDGMDSGIIDASIVMTHMILQAEESGVNSCWVLFFDADKLRAAFDLPENKFDLENLKFGTNFTNEQ